MNVLESNFHPILAKSRKRIPSNYYLYLQYIFSMKKHIFSLLFLLLTEGAAIAQKPFEGTIKFTFKIMGEAAQQLEAFMPTGSNHSIKGSDYLIQTEGGMIKSMLGDVLIKGGEGATYMIKENDKIAYKFTDEDNDGQDSPAKPVVTVEDEILEIAGFKCKKYKVELDSPQGPLTIFVWATNDLKAPAIPKKAGGMGSSSSVFMEGVDGIILKKMTSISQMGMSFTTIETANEVKAVKMSKKLFKVPGGYAVKPGKELMDKLGSMGGGM